MKILFNLMNCELGNNGGSRTLVNSANTLKKLGQDVIIIDSGKNQYTWEPLEVEHKIIKQIKSVPDADIIIATGYNTVSSTVNLPIRCGIKFHWIRGWETWKMSEQRICNNILKAKTTKIVNSNELKNKLKEYGVGSYLIRPGNTFEEFEPLNIRQKLPIILGGLYNEGSKRSGKRTHWIFDAYRHLKKIYPHIKLYMFGTDGVPKNEVDKFIKNPTKKEKNELLNQIHFWLAPTENEGLHIAPQEAMLAKCIVVGTNAPMSGMHDYLIDNETGFVSKNNFDSFLQFIKVAINSPYLNDIRVNARNKILELGNREDNMKQMIKLFESF